jgi:TatD DNase family protein
MTLFHKKRNMRFVDIHTHNNDCDKQSSIFNSNEYIADRIISMGIHPWEINDDWKECFAAIKKTAYKQNVVAIGECGIDKQKSPGGIELQKEIFKAHAMLAEETKKPLIIHCVKGIDEIIAIRRSITPKQAWIIHGFRGKPQQAEQLIKAGLCISFGEHFNTDSIKATPIERLFIESDDCNTDIRDIFQKIAEIKGCSVSELATSVMHNAQICNLIL